MTAYVVSEIEVTDPAGYERYRALVDPSFVGFNARFLVRGGSTDSLEGDPPKRIVIIAFDNIAEARRWYNSPSYTAAKLIRQDASIGRLYIVEG
jgi:uncharacterized protein (DUF1330 family)